MNIRRSFIFSAAIGTASLVSRPVRARSYPSRPLRLIVPFAAGGSTDIVARIIAPRLGSSLGVPVRVDNVAGAGGTAGTALMASAPPDGHTLCMATVSSTGSGPIVRTSLQYDPLNDLVPIIKLVDVPGVITVHRDFPARDYREFLEHVRSNPGRYSYASSGTGGVGHLGMELFKLRTRTFIVHLGFRGAGPALQEVVAGRIPIMWDNLSSSLPHIREGSLRAIGLAGARRSEQLPDLPTFAELGLHDYDAATYFGLLCPAGTPAAAVRALNQAANEALRDPEVSRRLVMAGGQVVGGGPGVLRRQIVNELKKWGAVARYARIRIAD